MMSQLVVNRSKHTYFISVLCDPPVICPPGRMAMVMTSFGRYACQVYLGALQSWYNFHDFHSSLQCLEGM